MKKSKKALSLLLALMLVLGAAGAGVMSASADDTPPAADITYSSENDWEGTLVIDESKTVKLSGVTHENDGTYGSPIKICGNSEVNLVFEGDNVLTANPSVNSAGIEVEEGSTVSIYGLEGSSLTVTGGRYSAGIGGIGYGSPSVENSKAGNVIIFSGNITVYGGDRGAGIGSGYHSSAGDIIIKGGNITAFGRGCGAGIGSGYGTSGGAAVANDGTPTAKGVGYYNGGNITISGGTVRAAATEIDFDIFDVFDSDTYYASEGYSDTFAAGIGGGYGASSGNIIIEGDADVTAFGSCGGAGIGTGRGTSDANKYDAENFFCNITIRGNAKVAAAAGADHRSSVVGDDGGAGIGLGRACTLEGYPEGTIVIEGNAQVTAVAEDHAAAIGAGSVVGKYLKDGDGNLIRPAYAVIESLSIGSECVVTAVNDGACGALEPADDLKNILRLNASAEFKEQYPAVFGDEADSIVFKGYDRESGEALSPEINLVFTPGSVAETFELMIPGSSDCVYFSDGEYLLGNEIEENPADFIKDPDGVKEYDLSCLCNTVTFVTYDNQKIPVDYPAGAATLTEPEVPQRDYYTAVWEEYELTGNITVNAVYTPVEYKAVFVDKDGETVDEIPYTVVTEEITPPEVPPVEGYTGAWEDYTLTPEGITVNPVYETVDYTAVFIADGKTVKEEKFTVETEKIDEPDVPAKEGYEGQWSEYTIAAGDMEINAVYTPAEYTAKFTADGKTVKEVKFTVETEKIDEPAVPAKEGYTGEWEKYELGAGDVEINALYTPVEYTAKFTADGKTVEEVKFTVETEKIDEPEVPAKEGYEGKWSEYTLAAGDIEITAVYTEISDEPATETEPADDNICPLDGTDHGTSFMGKIIKFTHSILWGIFKLLGLNLYIHMSWVD